MTVANGNRAASATWLTGSTFTALAVPLALFGSQPLDISLGNATLRGQLDDYALQYLGAAAAIGLGLGVLRLGTGDVESSAQTAALPLALGSATPIELPTPSKSLLTEESLKVSGLHAFLEADDAPLLLRPAPGVAQPQQSPAKATHTAKGFTGQVNSEADWLFPQAQPQPAQAQAPSAQMLPAETLAIIVAEVQAIMQQMSAQSQISIAPQFVAPAQPANVQTAPTNRAQSQPRGTQTTSLPPTVQQASPIFPASQSYVSFARTQAVLAQPMARNINAEVAVLDQIYQVREQMQQLMNQVDLIQADLEQTVYPTQRSMVLRAAPQPSYTVSPTEPIRATAGQMADSWANYHRALAS